MPDFNPTTEQQAIIRHDPQEDARILAGPGTGKSCTIVALVNRLQSQRPAPRIKLLTFTRAASSELARRVSAQSTTIVLRPSTIHSFAISVLLQNPGAGNILEPLRIADDWEFAEIIEKTLAKKIRVRRRQLDALIKEMSANWESLSQTESPRISPDDRARFLGAWNEHRQIYGYTLMAELPYALRGALHNHPDLEGINLDLAIVDEYQDLNACDLEVLRLIGQRGCSIVAAGDDDQSIYSFRKAAPEGIRRFLIDYPGARDYPLSITQRCGRRIIEWASFIIEADPNRARGRARPRCSQGSPEGEVALLSFAGHAAEAEGIAKLTKMLIERKAIPPSEILILIRSDYNASFSNLIKRQLDRLRVEYSDPNLIESILAEPGNRRCLAILRLIVNRVDSIAWGTLLKLSSGIGETFLDQIYEKARSSGSQFGTTLLEAYQVNFGGMSRAVGLRAHTLIQSVLSWIDSQTIPEHPEEGWGHWIISLSQQDGFLAQSDDFRELLSNLDNLTESGQNLDRFLGQIAPLSQDNALAHSDKVRIMTLRKAKGLTVRASIIGAVEEGIVPRPRCDPSEERRLLYVGMTRAKEYLFCTWARMRRGPTARAGAPRVGERRAYSTFLSGGPIDSQDGQEYIGRNT